MPVTMTKTEVRVGSPLKIPASGPRQESDSQIGGNHLGHQFKLRGLKNNVAQLSSALFLTLFLTFYHLKKLPSVSLGNQKTLHPYSAIGPVEHIIQQLTAEAGRVESCGGLRRVILDDNPGLGREDPTSGVILDESLKG